MHDSPIPPSTALFPVATPLRAWSAVITLAMAVFAVTVTEMMPIGLLPQISSGLHVSEGAAGLSVTKYEIVAGLSAPVMTSWLGILGVFVVDHRHRRGPTGIAPLEYLGLKLPVRGFTPRPLHLQRTKRPCSVTGVGTKSA